MQETISIANITPSIGGQKPLISHYPPAFNGAGNGVADITAHEKKLTEWFGYPVILFASGKSAIHTYLRVKKLSRFRDKVQIPDFFPTPLINVLIDFAFPLNYPEKGNGIWLYHQYGFPQLCEPETPVILEDIAHSFFTNPFTGKRKWQADVAVFSLSKFFSIAGSAGGLIIRDESVADEIRKIMSTALPDIAGIRDWMKIVISDAYSYYKEPVKYKNVFINSAYELLKTFYSPDISWIEGMPGDIDAISQIGLQRQERVHHYFNYFTSTENSFWTSKEELLPFAIPHFGNSNIEKLKKVNSALEEEGIRAGIYNIDINRNMYNPNYKPCILLPCHQDISMEDFDRICHIVKTNAT